MIQRLHTNKDSVDFEMMLDKINEIIDELNKR
jgi:hypothetical protein